MIKFRIKISNYACHGINWEAYHELSYFLNLTRFREKDRKAFDRVLNIMNDADTQFSLNRLSWLLEKYYGKQVVVLLDEYGTPMREAWVKGYWDELSGFFRDCSMPCSRQTGTWSGRL